MANPLLFVSALPNTRQLVTLAGVANNNGTLLTAMSVTCFLSLTSGTGVALVTNQALSSGVPGTFTTTLAATVFTPLATQAYFYPITGTVTVYDATGLGGVLLGTLSLIVSVIAPATGIYNPGTIEQVQLTGLADSNSVLQTPATATAYVSVTNANTGAVVYAQAALTYTAPGAWSGDLPATLSGPPFAITVTAYDSTGSGGVQRWQRTLITQNAH